MRSIEESVLGRYYFKLPEWLQDMLFIKSFFRCTTLLLSFVKLYTCKFLLRIFSQDMLCLKLQPDKSNRWVFKQIFSNLLFANFKSSLRRAGVYQRPSYMCTIVELHWRPRYLTCLPFAFFLSFLFLKFTCKKSSLLRVIFIYLSANKLENRIHR